MKARDAVKRTQQRPEVAGNPALITIIPVVIDVALKLIGACKKEPDAVAALREATSGQKARLVAETRRRLRDQGKPCSLDDARRAVDAACETARQATPAERVALLHAAYQAGDMV